MTVSKQPILELKHVSKRFGEATAVDDISLTVYKGEFLTLLGPSGCGKTTTLRMIAGLERCSSGEIHYQGKLIDAGDQSVFVPPNKREMGMVFQSYAIWPHMNVFENVAYPLRVRKVKKQIIEEEVERVLDLVGLLHLKERQSSQLSGGQQQRVALARSLVFHPNILLLDEPFSNLDVRLREQMRVEVRQIQKKIGITVVFVTHDQVEALSLSDRIVVMKDGRIEQVGTPEEVYDQPRTPFVRDFLGRVVNIRGRVEGVTDRGGLVVTAPGSLNQMEVDRHFLKHPQPDQDCIISVRSENLVVTPLERFENNGNNEGLILEGKIATAMFLGDQYEANIQVDDQVLHLYLPRKEQWTVNQRVALQLVRGVSVWPIAN
jgi:iron(III) transport system ATP-binding protein